MFTPEPNDYIKETFGQVKSSILLLGIGFRIDSEIPFR